MASGPTRPLATHRATSKDETRAIVDRLLTESGTPFNGWVILNDLGISGQAATQNEVVGRLARALKTEETPVRAVLAERVRQDLINQAPARTTNPS